MNSRRYHLTPDQRAIHRRYAELALPRHTSYPISPVWKADYGAGEFRTDLARSAAEGRPLSLYVHVPFCRKLCWYCACTKEIVPDDKRRAHDPADAFLDGLEREAERFAATVGRGPLHQVHLGGGSPTFLNEGQLRRLFGIVTRNFDIDSGAEVAVEVDPRITTLEQLQVLREAGCNRISLGVQDFDPEVQHAVNRLQPFEQVERLVHWCRDLGFGSINFDLIYGLPRQTLATMAATLEKTLRLRPDRIAFYRMAVIPDIFRWQNVFAEADLPAGDQSLDLNLLGIDTLLAGGYEFIGLDHFARADEALARARREGTLRRTFQGMTTGKHLDVLGLGPSAISMLDDAFAQNAKASGEWAQVVQTDFAACRGLHLDGEDRLRRELLQQLYGHGCIDKRSLEKEFGIVFDEHFAEERRRLEVLEADGLVEDTEGAIRLTEVLGRLLVRVAAAVFDRYLPAEAYREGLPAHLASRVG